MTPPPGKGPHGPHHGGPGPGMGGNPIPLLKRVLRYAF